MQFVCLFVVVSFVSTCVCLLLFMLLLLSLCSLTHFGGRPRARFSMIFSVRVTKKKKKGGGGVCSLAASGV